MLPHLSCYAVSATVSDVKISEFIFSGRFGVPSGRYAHLLVSRKLGKRMCDSDSRRD